jgi:hypothetical protein
MNGRLTAVTLATILGASAGCGSPHVGDADGAVDAGSGMDVGPDAPVLPPDAALRLIAPLSTATVTSRRPTLRWVLDPTCDGAHVQICRDRGCSQEVTSFDAAGQAGAPANDLPAGVLFWHAYGTNNGAVVEGWTPTWQFTVGTLSAPVDTSWGTTLDVNGDGYADVMIAAPGVGEAFLYLGGASGVDPLAHILAAPTGDTGQFGLLVASAGDVNGDGYADVLVDQNGEVFLYLGGPAGLPPSPALAIPDPGSPGSQIHAFGIRASSAGDVNGDGYADIVIGDNGAGKAYLYLGSAAGPNAAPDLTLTSPSTNPAASGFGHSIVGAGDVNGDGYADVAVGSDGAGQAFLYLGGAAGLSSSPDVTLTEPDPASGFGAVSSAGDVNGDGYADVLVGANGASVSAPNDFAGKAYVYLGSADGLATSPGVTLLGSEIRGTFGRWVSNAGDVNGDGYGDVVIGADGESGADAAGSPGHAYVYLGSALGLAASPAVTLIGPDGPGGWFGRCVAAAGDVNGDGYGDIVVGADAGGANTGVVGSMTGWAHLYLGNATGVASSPALTWTGPSDGSVFGRIVASAPLRHRRRSRPALKREVAALARTERSSVQR